MKAQILHTTPKEEQKAVIKKLKEEQHRKLTLLGEQVCAHSLIHDYRIGDNKFSSIFFKKKI